jgi:hypothetical protein
VLGTWLPSVHPKFASPSPTLAKHPCFLQEDARCVPATRVLSLLPLRQQSDTRTRIDVNAYLEDHEVSLHFLSLLTDGRLDVRVLLLRDSTYRLYDGEDGWRFLRIRLRISVNINNQSSAAIFSRGHT